MYRVYIPSIPNRELNEVAKSIYTTLPLLPAAQGFYNLTGYAPGFALREESKHEHEPEHA
jgi:hypothetical protein